MGTYGGKGKSTGDFNFTGNGKGTGKSADDVDSATELDDTSGSEPGEQQ